MGACTRLAHGTTWLSWDSAKFQPQLRGETEPRLPQPKPRSHPVMGSHTAKPRGRSEACQKGSPAARIKCSTVQKTARLRFWRSPWSSQEILEQPPKLQCDPTGWHPAEIAEPSARPRRDIKSFSTQVKLTDLSWIREMERVKTHKKANTDT